MRYYKRALGSLSFILTSCLSLGCASKPPMIEKPIEKIFTLEAPLDLAWKSTIQALVERGVSITILDKESHLIVVEEQMSGENFQQYTAERGVFLNGVARLNILFQEEREGRMKAYINSTLQGYTGRWLVYATSNGKIEKDYFLLITSNLPQKKSYPWLDKKKGEDKVVPPNQGSNP